MLINYLQDLVKFTTGLGVNHIKVSGENGSVTVEGTKDANKTLVIKGKFLKPVSEFDGVCGLSDLEWLTNYVNAYKIKGDTATVVRKDITVFENVVDNNGNLVFNEDGNPEQRSITKNLIEEINFKRSTQPKMNNVYRVMNVRMIEDQPKFGGIDWDVEIEPTTKSIEVFATQAGFGVEKYFSAITNEDGTLIFNFGKSASIDFAYDVEGELGREWSWEIKPVLDILKLSSVAECSMHFSSTKGALQLTLNTGLAEYNYIMPAKAN